MRASSSWRRACSSRAAAASARAFWRSWSALPDRAVGQQAAQARFVGRGLLRVHRRRLHLVGGGAHGQLMVGRVQPRQHLAGLHDIADFDQPVHHLAARAETEVRFDTGADHGGERARLRRHGLLTVVTKTGLTTAAGAGGSLQAASRAPAAATAASGHGGEGSVHWGVLSAREFMAVPARAGAKPPPSAL